MEKERAKLSLFVDCMICYMENTKESTKKFPDLKKEFSKVTEYS